MASKQSTLAKRTPKQPDRLHISMDAHKKSYAGLSSSPSLDNNDIGSNNLRVVVFPQVCGIDGCTFVFHTPNATGPHINNRHKGKNNVFKGKMHRVVKRGTHVAAKKRPIDEKDEEEEEDESSDEEEKEEESGDDSSIESVQPSVIARNIEERIAPATKKPKIEPPAEKNDVFRMILKNQKDKQRLDEEQKALDTKEKELLLYLGTMEMRRLMAQQSN